jgi:hypothetical protein
MKLFNLLFLVLGSNLALAQVSVSEIFSGSANTVGIYSDDYVEIRNFGVAVEDISGSQVYYAAATGTVWFLVGTIPSSTNLAPGGVYVICCFRGTAIANSTLVPCNVPSPSPTVVNMAGASGKVLFLRNGSTPPTSGTACPAGVLAYGNTGSSSGCSTIGTATLTSTTSAQYNGSVWMNAAPSPGQINLPVQLVTFHAQSESNLIVLDFITASECQNAYFEIERSSDGQSFQSIGSLKGAGNSAREINYSFIDASPNIGINYYRLKQVDLDGLFEYSKIVSARFGSEVRLNVTPTLVIDYLKITLDKTLSEARSWEIVDLNGRIVFTGVIEAEQFDFAVDLSALQVGAYFVRVNSGDFVWVERVVKI